MHRWFVALRWLHGTIILHRWIRLRTARLRSRTIVRLGLNRLGPIVRLRHLWTILRHRLSRYRLSRLRMARLRTVVWLRLNRFQMIVRLRRGCSLHRCRRWVIGWSRLIV